MSTDNGKPNKKSRPGRYINRSNKRSENRSLQLLNNSIPIGKPTTMPPLRSFPFFGFPSPKYNPFKKFYVSEILRIPPPPDMQEMTIIEA